MEVREQGLEEETVSIGAGLSLGQEHEMLPGEPWGEGAYGQAVAVVGGDVVEHHLAGEKIVGAVADLLHGQSQVVDLNGLIEGDAVLEEIILGQRGGRAVGGIGDERQLREELGRNGFFGGQFR